jgi:RNA-directed DNA polymerase
VVNLIGQYLRRTSERGGSFWDYEKGISLGCPLSPLIGGFFLNALDAAAAKLRLFYVRFMDDILILAPTRWQLRGAVKAVNQTLSALSLEKHPDKTFIGRIERGFDFLGYHFSPTGLTVAKQTIANFIEKASRLYEQKRSAVLAATALEMYVRRWVRWAVSGIPAVNSQSVLRSFRSGGQGCGSRGAVRDQTLFDF